MKKLVLVRHTESEHLAASPDSQLMNDSPLSAKGREDALKLQQSLAALRPDIILSSLYLRAQQTADILNEKWGVKVLSTMLLNEYFLRTDGSGVESSEDALVRAVDCLNKYRTFCDTIMIVSHKSLLSTLMAGMLNMNYGESEKLFKQPGTAYVLSYDWLKGEENWNIQSEFLS